MSTVKLLNGFEGDYENGLSWASGTAPGPGDVAVIDATGDAPAALADDGSGNIFADVEGDSIADLTGNVVVTPLPEVFTSFLSDPPITYEVFPDTSPAASTNAGETVDGQTIDLIGGGSVATLFLQNSTLGGASTVNVSGTALLDAEFGNTLDGTISIGSPFSVNGVPVVSPAANANGAVDELDIRIRAAGSWTLNSDTSYSVTGFVPSVTNNGSIVVGADSALRVQMAGQDGGPVVVAADDVEVDPPEATAFVNAGTITVGPGGAAGFYAEVGTPVGAPTGDAGPLELVTNTGTIAVTGQAGATTSLLVQTAFTGGTVLVGGGGATTATFTNVVAGTRFVIGDGTLRLVTATNGLGSGLAGQFAGGSIAFVGSGGVLSIGSERGSYNDELDTAIGNVSAPITGFAAGDSIEETFEFGASSSINSEGTFSFQTIWNQAAQQLQIQETVVPPFYFSDRTPQTAIIGDLTLMGTYDASDFSISAPTDVSENSSVTLTITVSEQPCFAAGTRIATPDGDMAVEAVRAGDAVLLADGSTATVRWVGHRRVDCRTAPSQAPVRVRAGALESGVPSRDLVVSPDHALFLDGVLVPAQLLVNGLTVVRDERERVVYHHVELERHGVLLAENTPAESYLDTGNRDRFANCALGYDPVDAAMNDPCAEVVFGGWRLERITARLRERAAVQTA